jgi:hypothetical protein
MPNFSNFAADKDGQHNPFSRMVYWGATDWAPEVSVWKLTSAIRITVFRAITLNFASEANALARSKTFVAHGSSEQVCVKIH